MVSYVASASPQRAAAIAVRMAMARGPFGIVGALDHLTDAAIPIDALARGTWAALSPARG